jgi:predicted nucleic acid-binding protein
MGDYAHSVQSGWTVYERWIEDPRVELRSEPRDIDSAFRQTTAHFATQPASKWIGDCYLLAFASQSGATRVTFDKALLRLARTRHYAAIIPS